MLDQAAALALFAIVVGGTQGPDRVTKELPLHVEDQGDAFLVVGSPYTMGKLVRYAKCHVVFAKSDAEVPGYGCDGRQILSKAQEADWHRRLTPDEFDRAFGESSHWRRDGIRDFVRAIYGGVVNTPADATAYAKVLLQTTPRDATLAHGRLTAVERDNVWHITRAPDDTEIMTFSRTTGKLLSPLP